MEMFDFENEFKESKIEGIRHLGKIDRVEVWEENSKIIVLVDGKSIGWINEDSSVVDFYELITKVTGFLTEDTKKYSCERSYYESVVSSIIKLYFDHIYLNTVDDTWRMSQFLASESMNTPKVTDLHLWKEDIDWLRNKEFKYLQLGFSAYKMGVSVHVEEKRGLSLGEIWYTSCPHAPIRYVLERFIMTERALSDITDLVEEYNEYNPENKVDSGIVLTKLLPEITELYKETKYRYPELYEEVKADMVNNKYKSYL